MPGAIRAQGLGCHGSLGRPRERCGLSVEPLLARLWALPAIVGALLAFTTDASGQTPWIPTLCPSTWAGPDTWLVSAQSDPATVIGFTVNTYDLVSFPAVTGLYKPNPRVPTYQLGTTLWKWVGAQLPAICQKRTWNLGLASEFTEINASLGPAQGYATVLRQYGEDTQTQQEGGGGDGAPPLTVNCYYWDYYDDYGNFLYRQWDYCTPA